MLVPRRRYQISLNPPYIDIFVRVLIPSWDLPGAIPSFKMPTRAAAKREAAFLKESLGAGSLSSPPATPITSKESEVNPTGDNDMTGQVEDNSDETQMSAPASVSAKRKRAPPKSKKMTEPINGGWDVLPHGMGKKGDLVEGADDKAQNATEPVPPPKRRARRGKANDEGGNAIAADVDSVIKTEDQDKVNTVTTGFSRTSSPKEVRRKAKAESVDGDVKDENSEGEKPAKKRAPRKKKAVNVNTFESVLDKVNDLVDATASPAKKKRAKKHPYGLTPGQSPFPDHVKPTPGDCEEVTRLLSELHGAVTAPEVIPPPSMEVTGCGEVPDLLDAILRTLLSASTTAQNANMSLKGLKDRFGLRTSGIGAGSVNWEAVHRAELPDVIEAIKRGGLAKSKGTNIKKILETVYQQNCARRDALLKEKETGELADIAGAKRETQERKDVEIKMADDGMLSMDHVFEMTTDEAMEEMTKLPGIGVKTASCVILFCMKRPSFAVDTHVWRHCKWLGWVPAGATRDQTFSHCEVRVPDHLKYPLHQLFLRHGKTCGRCRANTSAGTEEWNNTVCPIDHLATRTEGKKIVGRSLVKIQKGGSGKKRSKKSKKKGNETEESELEMEVEMSEQNDEVSDNASAETSENATDDGE